MQKDSKQEGVDPTRKSSGDNLPAVFKLDNLTEKQLAPYVPLFKGTIEDKIRAAKLLCDTGIVPYSKPADFIIIDKVATDLGIPFHAACSNLYVVKGRLTMGAHLMSALMLRAGVVTLVLEDYVPINHYKGAGGVIYYLSSDDVENTQDKFEITTTEKVVNGTVDPNRMQLIKVLPRLIDDKPHQDHRTTIRLVRRKKLADGEFMNIDVVTSYRLEEAYLAGFMGANIDNPKDNWYGHPGPMCFARCLSRVANRYAADVIYGTPEFSDIADIENVAVSFDSEGYPIPE